MDTVEPTPDAVEPSKLAHCVFHDRHEAELFLAREIAELVEERRDEGAQATIALAAGRTPIGLYAELARMRETDEASFGDVVAFQLDEFVGVNAEHPASFKSFLDTHLFEPAGFDPERFHRLRGEVPPEEVEAVCRAYEESIREAGGLDLAVLGLGTNGHVAFNEPGSSATSRTREVGLTPDTRARHAEDFAPGEPPRSALTLGIATLVEARRIRLMAFGESKADVVRDLLRGPISADLPATFLRGHPDAMVVLDRPAAGSLS